MSTQVLVVSGSARRSSMRSSRWPRPAASTPSSPTSPIPRAHRLPTSSLRVQGRRGATRGRPQVRALARRHRDAAHALTGRQRRRPSGPAPEFERQTTRCRNTGSFVHGGPGRIRTFVGEADGFTARSLWPLGHRPVDGPQLYRPGPALRPRRCGRRAFGRRHRRSTVGAMPTFDVVSEVDMQEVRHAVDQAAREVSQRFDFKGTDSSVELGDNEIKLASSWRIALLRSGSCSKRSSPSAKSR